MEKSFIIILEFESGQVYITEYDSNKYDDPEEFFVDLNEEHNLNITENNSQWMIVKDKLLITNL